MPQAPNNEIPYNVPWGKKQRPHDPGALRTRATTVAQPQGWSQEALLRRSLEILENPSRPAGSGSWLSRGVVKAGIVAIVLSLAILAAIFIYYEYSKGTNQPIIIRVDFPTEIPADGTIVPGKIHFQDRNRDISYVKFDVLEGAFRPFEFDPKVFGRAKGSIDFRIWCSIPQRVMLKVTVLDRRGHSTPFYLGFQCVAPYERVWDTFYYFSSKPELRWSYPTEYTHNHNIVGFRIYRCSFPAAKDPWKKFCLYEWDFKRIASVGEDRRSFRDYTIEHPTPGAGFCYVISAYNWVWESKRIPIGCYVRSRG